MKKVSEPFHKHEVEEYERKRYQGLDQRIVNTREQSILKKFLEQITKKKGLALDLPCGYGRFSKLLGGQGLRPVNCDISFHMVKRACEKSGGIGSSEIAGAVANAKQGLPFKDGVFQVVFSLRFFHHLHEKQARTFILTEFSRVSKGWVVLSFYQANPLHKIQRQLRRKVKKSSTRIKMLLAEEFAEEIAQAGLKPVRIIPLFKGLHSQHIALLKKKSTLQGES